MAILSEKRQKCFGLRRKDVRMRAIICDDDGRFAKKLEQLIMQYYRNMGMTIDTTVVTNPQNLLKRNDLANFDIAFLDADMKPIDGIEVGRALRKRKPKIIIVFVWIYVRCASVNAATAFDRLYDLIDEAAGHGFLVRGTSFDHCSGNTLKDRNGLRAMLDAVENNLVEAVIVRDLEQISRNSYLLVGVIEIFRRRDVYLITTECDLNTELINCGLERFAGDRFTRASFGKPRFDVRLPLMDQF